MNHSQNSADLNGVAIIGMAGRFPGAASVDDLWRNLCEGVESITFFADNDLEPTIDTALKNNPDYIKARGILEDVDKFDATFFHMSPREAEIMDPQQRIFLEVGGEGGGAALAAFFFGGFGERTALIAHVFADWGGGGCVGIAFLGGFDGEDVASAVQFSAGLMV